MVRPAWAGPGPVVDGGQEARDLGAQRVTPPSWAVLGRQG